MSKFTKDRRGAEYICDKEPIVLVVKTWQTDRQTDTHTYMHTDTTLSSYIGMEYQDYEHTLNQNSVYKPT